MDDLSRSFIMLLIGGNNVFFGRVTHAYFFQYCGWARKTISLKDPLFITPIIMFHIKTIKETQCPLSIIILSESCPIVMTLTFENNHFVNHGLVKNTKLEYLGNKKLRNLCLRWNIFRSYHFIAEVTFEWG